MFVVTSNTTYFKGLLGVRRSEWKNVFIRDVRIGWWSIEVNLDVRRYWRQRTPWFDVVVCPKLDRGGGRCIRAKVGVLVCKMV